MQHVAVVGRLHRPCQALDQGGSLLRRQGSAGQVAVQTAACAILHGEEGLAVVVGDFEDLHNASMLQAGHGLGLAAEAAHVGCVGAVRTQYLEGDEAVGLELAGLVDDAHAALAQPSEHLVAWNGGERFLPLAGPFCRFCRCGLGTVRTTVWASFGEELLREQGSGKDRRRRWASCRREHRPDERDGGGEAGQVFLGNRLLASSSAIGQVQPQQLGQQHRPHPTGKGAEQVLHERTLALLPGAFELTADALHRKRLVGGQIAQQRQRRFAHGWTSTDHRVRISASAGSAAAASAVLKSSLLSRPGVLGEGQRRIAGRTGDAEGWHAVGMKD